MSLTLMLALLLAAPERKGSELTPGAPSRWSNAGAMSPIEADVPITAPMPERNVPKPVGVETPGQRLTDADEQLSAHFSFSISHLETARQDFGLVNGAFAEVNRDHDLFRGRGSMSYERIGGSWFSVHFDAEYRGRSAGSRPTEYRLNAAHVAWGLSDFRRRDAPAFGVALGRVAVPEAGWAQADGALLRVRALEGLHLGAFGGVSGNPYRYNWRVHETQEFGTDWITSGLFAAYQRPELYANLAGVLTLHEGVDRAHAFLDAGWAIADGLDAFLTAWIDVLPSGEPIQNLELIAAWSPLEALDLRLSLARFATLSYESVGESFRADPTGAVLRPASNAVALDERGVPILPFDTFLQVAVYDAIRLRGGYRLGPLEPFLTIDTYVREPRSPPAVDLSPLRLLPGAGAIYREDALFDAELRVTGIIDEETETRLVVQGGLTRRLFGVSLGADARVFAGGVLALDGGFDASWALPRDWLPGRLMFRGVFRYFREDVALPRPFLEQPRPGPLGDQVALPLVPAQESFLGFFGVDWRL